MADTPLTAGLSALADLYIPDHDLVDTLGRVVHLVVGTVEPADLCGVMLVVDGRPQTTAFSDDRAVEVDRSQYQAGEGPCLEAFARLDVVDIPSIADSGPWPRFRRAAADHGVRSCLSLPLAVGEVPVGTINLYARRPQAFDRAAREAATAFGARASVVIANAVAYWDAHTQSTTLTEALTTRAVIEQAKGILMGAQGCDADTAFQMLARASQRENTKLRDVAARIVAATVARGRADNGAVPRAER